MVGVGEKNFVFSLQIIWFHGFLLILIFKDFLNLCFNEITTRPGDCLVVGWGQGNFFTTRLSHGGDGDREIFISSKIQIKRNP